jgi:hypothetical protein
VIPVPNDFDSDALEVSMRRNGDVAATATGKVVIDDHFLSLATLANVLGRYERRIEARAADHHRLLQQARREQGRDLGSRILGTRQLHYQFHLTHTKDLTEG